MIEPEPLPDAALTAWLFGGAAALTYLAGCGVLVPGIVYCCPACEGTGIEPDQAMMARRERKGCFTCAKTGGIRFSRPTLVERAKGEYFGRTEFGPFPDDAPPAWDFIVARLR